MIKILFIGGLIAILIFFIVRRLGLLGKSGKTPHYLPQSEWMEIGLDNHSMKNVVKRTMFTVFVGFILLLLVLVLTAKFRIALIMLPISLYLIGQYFVLMNQIKAYRAQQIFYNPTNKQVRVRSMRFEEVSFNLLSDGFQVEKIRAVQKNNGVLFGYFDVFVAGNKIVFPFILQHNLRNTGFFNLLTNHPSKRITKLFPII